MGALSEALLSPEGITISPQLLRYLGRVIYCNAPQILDTRLSEVMMTKRRVTAW
jgi:hypothetical protein